MIIFTKGRIINLAQVAYLSVERLHPTMGEYELVAYYSQMETNNGKDRILVGSYDTEEAANHVLEKIASAYADEAEVFYLKNI